MFAKFMTVAAAGIAAVRACDGASGLSTNPLTSPSANNWPTIGKPFNVLWSTDYADKSPEVTLSLYQITGACPGSACVELADIAGFYANNGSFTWTPDSSLKPGNNYALLFINEDPCKTVWGAAFGINAAGSSSGGTVAPAAAALVTSQGVASGAASTGAPAASGGAAAAASSGGTPAISSGGAAAAQQSVPVITSFTTMTSTTTLYSDVASATPGAGAAAGGGNSVDVITVMKTTTVYLSAGQAAPSGS